MSFAARFALAAAIAFSMLGGVARIAPAEAGVTLDRIKEEGVVKCGATRSGRGLSEISVTGDWQGLFIDFCRALAAAVLDDPKAIEIVEVDDVIRFDALTDGAFDVLTANTTWTVSRDTARGMIFTGIYYYDGQGFLAHRSLDASRIAEVSSGVICVPGGTTTVKNLEELTAGLDSSLETHEFHSIDMVYEAFFARRCDIITYDRIALISQLHDRADNPENFVLFTDVVSKEPLGPAVRRDDLEWADVVRWTVFATIAAEELGIHSGNLDEMASTGNPEVLRLLGIEGEIGPGMGLTQDWARRIIGHVGNYGEIFDRHLGQNGLGVPRGLNALWRDGGLHYAPPIR